MVPQLSAKLEGFRGLRFFVRKAVLAVVALVALLGLLLFGGVICFHHRGVHAGRFNDDCNTCSCMPGGGVRCTAVDCTPPTRVMPTLKPSASP
jgi:hypothetical protein